MEKNDPAHGFSREAAWRGALTPEQRKRLESRLAAHPEENGVWEEEVALTRLLSRLPDAAAPSNLTARVLDEIDECAPELPNGFGLGWLRKVGWVPRLAGVAVLVMVGYMGHHQYQVSKMAKLARDVAEVTVLATVGPSVDVLQDFTAIRNLDSAAAPDEELLTLLQ